MVFGCSTSQPLIGSGGRVFSLGYFMKTCPECCSDIPDQAEVCHACGRRIKATLELMKE
jgi:rRNA maturation endonuclease Nob1